MNNKEVFEFWVHLGNFPSFRNMDGHLQIESEIGILHLKGLKKYVFKLEEVNYIEVFRYWVILDHFS